MGLQWIFSFLTLQSTEAYQSLGPNEENGENKGGESEELENSTTMALRQVADLPSDEVGHLEIIDLSSTATIEILKSEISLEKFNSIIAATYFSPW
ncbi:unnamed protein product [Rhizopus stolonifer]